jgi:N4-gp56 family major capsid protein
MCSSANSTALTAGGVEVATMDSSATMTVSGIRYAVYTLKKNKAPKWDNGNYRGVLNSDAIYQLQGDTQAGNWINIGLYNSESNAEMLKKGVIGSLYGVDIVETNLAFCASDKAGTVSPTGRSSFFAGKGAVAEVKLQGNGDAKIIYKQGGDQDTSNPLNMYSTLGWKVEGYVAVVLNGDWLINYKHYGTMTAVQGAQT